MLIGTSSLCKLIKDGKNFVELFREDDSSINEDYFDSLKEFLNDNNIWHIIFYLFWLFSHKNNKSKL